MGSPSTRNAIWQGLLDIERYVRYCDALTRRYRRYGNIIRILLGVSAVGSVVELLVRNRQMVRTGLNRRSLLAPTCFL